MFQSTNLTESVYTLLSLLPRFNHLTPRKILPYNGIYIFYERGETIGTTDRIVRVGIKWRIESYCQLFALSSKLQIGRHFSNGSTGTPPIKQGSYKSL